MTTHDPGYDREEHERLYTAGRALRERLQAQADQQRKHREFATYVTEHAEQLTALNDRLNSGVPIENLPAQDIKFLVGEEEKRHIYRMYGGNKRSRWHKAVYEALPSPPPDASDHIRETWGRWLDRIHKRKYETVRGLAKQEGRWYRELARREVVALVAKHVPPCSRHCTRDEWTFILDVPPFLADFDPTGNYRPPADTDPEEEPS